jgi:hypothetical protein
MIKAIRMDMSLVYELRMRSFEGKAAG